MSYEVLDTPFNRANYASIIGQVLAEPPAYANVRKVDKPVKPSPWRGPVDKDMNKKYRDAQLMLLPSNLGHGWFETFYPNMSDEGIEAEASSVQSSGHHVALFKEGPKSYRIWHSEVASSDPLDRGGAVARWFDYRPK